MQATDICKQDPEVNIFMQEDKNGEWKNFHYEKIHCYYSVQTILSSGLLSEKLKIETYKTIILPVLLYGCETWSPTLREECRLLRFENRDLK